MNSGILSGLIFQEKETTGVIIMQEGSGRWLDNKDLKYQYLANWDKAMINTIKQNKVLASAGATQINMDSNNKVISL